MKFFLLTIFSIVIFNFCQAQTNVSLANTMWTKKGIHPKPQIVSDKSELNAENLIGISFSDSTVEWLNEQPIEYNNYKSDFPIFYYKIKKVIDDKVELISTFYFDKNKKVVKWDELKITFLTSNKMKVQSGRFHSKMILTKIN